MCNKLMVDDIIHHFILSGVGFIISEWHLKTGVIELQNIRLN